jgi:Bacterial inner membrane protein
MTLQWIGWAATLMTVSSYFCKSPRTLRLVQAVAAVAWASYGVAISAAPIIAANVLVAGVAVWSAWRGIGERPAVG